MLIDRKALLISADESLIKAVKMSLEPIYAVASKKDLRQACKAATGFKLILLDINRSGKNIKDSIEELNAANPDALLISVVAKGEIKTAVNAIKAGAYDYVEKPVDPDEMKIIVEKAYKYIVMQDEMAMLRSKKSEPQNYSIKDFLEERLNGFICKMTDMKNPNLYENVISETEKALFGIVLNATDGNQVRAAKLLGINRNTLSKKMKEYKLI